MKYIILTLLFSINVNAVENWRAVGFSQTNYQKGKAQCVAAESTPCFDISGHNMRYTVVGLIDNLESPTYANRVSEPCSDSATCQAINAIKDCSAFTDAFVVVAIDFSEVYCAEPNGFNQMPGLVEDAGLKVTADLEDAQKISDQAARDVAKGPREVSLQACVQDSKNPTLTPEQIKLCINALVREMLGDKVEVTDL